MPRVVGIDPGTLSIDLCGLANGVVFLERSVETVEFTRRPETLLDVLRAAKPLDLIAGPSGYGLPLVPIAAVGERELRLMCLAEAGAGGGIGGLRTLVAMLRDAGLPAVFTPGVVHLASVPPHRKLNRIDLGTADKVCAVAFAIEQQAARERVTYGETSFVLVEMGGAFTAVLSVDRGRIVSGQGGSSGPLGFRAAGALDGEAALAASPLTKDTVFSGGVAWAAGDPTAAPDVIALRVDDVAVAARAAFVESLARAVAGELAVVPQAREILLSGRLSRIAGFRDPAAAALSSMRPVRDLAPATATKEAARGAALIADGLAGGDYAPLVEVMGLRASAGTALDHLYLLGADQVRVWAAGGS
jgi:predicted butyrate kinase (DUF1464 family)